MQNDPETKPWLQTLPGLLSATAGLIGAITALIVALGGKDQSVEITKGTITNAAPHTSSAPPQGCIPPYVWRLAVPSDHICVTDASRKRVELENQRAAERRQASGLGTYGADTMMVVSVWWPDDAPATRPYGGSKHLLKAFLETMGVCPSRDSQEPRSAACQP